MCSCKIVKWHESHVYHKTADGYLEFKLKWDAIYGCIFGIKITPTCIFMANVYWDIDY